MDPKDFIADLEEENRTLRRQLAEEKEASRRLREELRVARERKVEEVSPNPYPHFVDTGTTNSTQRDEGLPPEETNNQPKKEEKTDSGRSIAATKHEVKQEVKPKKSVGNKCLFRVGSLTDVCRSPSTIFHPFLQGDQRCNCNRNPARPTRKTMTTI